MTTRTLVVLAFLGLSGCVGGDPVAPRQEQHPSDVVLNRLASAQGDSLELMADSSYFAKSAKGGSWVAGRYWFSTTVVDTNRLCALPNSVKADDYIDCSVWEPKPGQLEDPFSVFLRDGAVKEWTRVR